MRIPLPVEPSLLPMLMTMLVPSCAASGHARSGRVLVGDRRRYDVERVFKAGDAISASIVQRCNTLTRQGDKIAYMASLELRMVMLALTWRVAQGFQGPARYTGVWDRHGQKLFRTGG